MPSIREITKHLYYTEIMTYLNNSLKSSKTSGKSVTMVEQTNKKRLGKKIKNNNKKQTSDTAIACNLAKPGPITNKQNNNV